MRGERPVSIEEQNKAILRRWYDEMYAQRRFEELMPQLAGPVCVVHQLNRTRLITIDEYAEEVAQWNEGIDYAYTIDELIAEGDKVAVLVHGERNGELINWLQLFRLEDGKIVETWYQGFTRNVQW